MIHIGQLFEQKLQEHGTTKAWLATKLYCHRTNFNDIIRRKSIDSDLLLQISKVLDFNFFVYYTDEYNAAKNP